MHLNIIKKSKSNFVLEYPIWVSIKKTLTGKLAVDGQNFIYCVRFQENVKKPKNQSVLRYQLFLEVSGRFL